jgi:hypothetical protein
MNEEIQMLMDETIERMEHALKHLDNELAHIRAGKASPRMIEGVQVDDTAATGMQYKHSRCQDNCHPALGEKDDSHH